MFETKDGMHLAKVSNDTEGCYFEFQKMRELEDFKGFVKVPDAGEISTLDNGESLPHPLAFIIVEKPNGRPLSEITLDFQGTCQIGIALLGKLAKVHNAGLVVGKNISKTIYVGDDNQIQIVCFERVGPNHSRKDDMLMVLSLLT